MRMLCDDGSSSSSSNGSNGDDADSIDSVDTTDALIFAAAYESSKDKLTCSLGGSIGSQMMMCSLTTLTMELRRGGGHG